MLNLNDFQKVNKGDLLAKYKDEDILTTEEGLILISNEISNVGFFIVDELKY